MLQFKHPSRLRKKRSGHKIPIKITLSNYIVKKLSGIVPFRKGGSGSAVIELLIEMFFVHMGSLNEEDEINIVRRLYAAFNNKETFLAYKENYRAFSANFDLFLQQEEANESKRKLRRYMRIIHNADKISKKQ